MNEQQIRVGYKLKFKNNNYVLKYQKHYIKAKTLYFFKTLRRHT